MLLHTFNTPGLAINSYLIADSHNRQALVIDPTREFAPYLNYAKKENLTITDIVETHVHADFVSGALELKQALNGFPKIHCSALGGKEWTPHYADRRVQNGDIIDFHSFRVMALHTPGHTYEHVIWLCYDKTKSLEIPHLAFTGDFLFVGSVGRPDLLGKGDAEKLSEKLYDSLFVKIAALPDALEIYPAHGAGSLCGKALSSKPASTLGHERLFNPMLQKKPFDEWLFYLNAEVPGAPPNFARIKKINIKGPSRVNVDPHQSPSIYIDIRTPDKFAKSHIKEALNIPIGASFCNWVGSVLFEEANVGLIADNAADLSMAINNLKLIGFDQIGASLLWDKEELMKRFVLESENPIEVVNLFAQIQSNSAGQCIVDVRTLSEWNQGHIKEAQHIELPCLVYERDKIPKSSRIYMVCGSGYRASIAASYFKKQGYPSVYNITGGMNAWNRAGLPVIRSESV
jgi:hydroxyacylglutathione hydrolase